MMIVMMMGNMYTTNKLTKSNTNATTITIADATLLVPYPHLQTDWYGQNILTYTHPDDHVFLKQQLVPTDLDTMFDIQPVLDSAGEQRPRTQEEEDLIDQKLRQDRRDITIRYWLSPPLPLPPSRVVWPAITYYLPPSDWPGLGRGQSRPCTRSCV